MTLDLGCGCRLGRTELQAHRGAAPDFFEVVVSADGRLHDVHHGRAAVDNDPLAVVFALDAGLGKTGVAHLVAHAGGQRLGLAVRGARGDDDPLKQRGQVFGVKHLDFLGLDVLQCVHDGPLEFLDVFFGGVFGHQWGL